MRKLFLPLVLLALLCQGCAQVKPWERGNLARPEMAFTSDALELKVQDHVYHSKEAAQTITAGAGGGCGCN